MYSRNQDSSTPSSSNYGSSPFQPQNNREIFVNGVSPYDRNNRNHHNNESEQSNLSTVKEEQQQDDDDDEDNLPLSKFKIK